jgi:hypothetical protein
LLLFPIVIQVIEVPLIQASTGVDDPSGVSVIRMFFGGLTGLAMLTGVILGIVALFGISKYGTKGILVKSLFGILLPLILVLLSIPVLMRAHEIAAQRAEHQADAVPGN